MGLPAWEEVAGKTVKQSFKISFITNAIDSTKDDI
jgi:hypothetical protein